MNVFRVEIRPAAGRDGGSRQVVNLLHEAGLDQAGGAECSRLFLLEGTLSREDARRIAGELLADPVTEVATVDDRAPAAAPAGRLAVEVHLKPGVMDPVAESTLVELRAAGEAVETVRTARRYILSGVPDEDSVRRTVARVLANDCIEQVVFGAAPVGPAPRPPEYRFKLRTIPLRDLNPPDLEQLSRAAHLFLSIAEMKAIQEHYRGLGRDPTDLELETLAQTWSEHCVHKTLTGEFEYRGAPMPNGDGGAHAAIETRHYGNLLKETIAAATRELMAAGRGPRCLSVFKDNAGVIEFDEQFGLAFKVETHNHPSAIEPYGGAATGIGGVIRDVIGCGLGAKPIANTDVFCVAPGDWPIDRLPKGVLHPRRVLRGIVRGVGDYGNRMGIPTVNGAVYFDPRYLGNPLVYCGCLGLLPRDKVSKAARPGDLVVLIGGRTGRDGIHGATFSSAELTDSHADEFSHAVQIGNAITEKRFLDAVLMARDEAPYSAITDCGAGGLSSAVGEMGEQIGAEVDLEKVPLKYAGLRYDEIWISEAQERMVVAVPPATLPRFMEIMRAEEVEATVIGTFGCSAPATGTNKGARPRLLLRYEGQVVGDLDVAFLRDGRPKGRLEARWAFPTSGGHTLPRPLPQRVGGVSAARLLAELRRGDVASKAWIIRGYDHEVQGGSVIKPLGGPGRGPADAAVLRPRLESQRGVALGCGLSPHLSDVDPYWMAVASIDEAVRNVVCVGGDLKQTALLDNFCWGRSDDVEQLGALVRACQACYDVAVTLGTPFISGKDSLNNEFALDETDVEPLIATLRGLAGGESVEAGRLRVILPGLERRLRERRRLAIVPTLLISAISVVSDVQRCVSPDLKRPGNSLVLVGGLPTTGFALAKAAGIHQAVAGLIEAGHTAACHDVSDGGWLVTVAEMALSGQRGARLLVEEAASPGPLEECCAAYVIETGSLKEIERELAARGVSWRILGMVTGDDRVEWPGQSCGLGELREEWGSRGGD